MKTFGLTGGIACGKSNVTKTFRANGIPIVDADVIARELVIPGANVWGMIRAMFGHHYLNEDETLNRSKLGALVFRDAQALYNLNSIMAPAISLESNRQIKAWHDAGHNIVGYDAALIIEQGNANKYRPLIVVGCAPEIQLKRLMKRNGLTEDEARARINSQMSFADKAKHANYIITTDGSKEDSVQQTLKIIKLLQLS